MITVTNGFYYTLVLFAPAIEVVAVKRMSSSISQANKIQKMSWRCFVKCRIDSLQKPRFRLLRSITGADESRRFVRNFNDFARIETVKKTIQFAYKI